MKDLKGYIFLASTLLIIYLAAQYNKPKPVDWSPTFSNNDKIPFGTYIIYNRLNDLFPSVKIDKSTATINTDLNIDSTKGNNYIIICNAIELDKYDYKKLTDYIKQGNNVFIASSYFGTLLSNKLKIKTQSEFSGNDYTANVEFVNKKLVGQTFYVDMNCTKGYFAKFDTTKAIVVGQNSLKHANFIQFKMGSGSLYLNANPQLFTNYSLLQPSGAKYAATSLSFLNKSNRVIWNEFYSNGPAKHASTMQVFLKYKELKWTFYLVFFGLLVYVLYQMKRRQRIIPVIEPVKNASVQFATVVGQVYYEKHNNKNIVEKKISYFLERIRNKYQLKTTIHDTDFMELLAKKSGVELPLIRSIFRQIEKSNSDHLFTDDELITLNSNIEQFYKKAF